MHPKVRLAIDVALATGLLLRLRGEPGSGKSSLAPYLARNLRARYLEEVVVAATRVEDFLWRFDTVRKLSDAQARQQGEPPKDDSEYMVEGVLWRAFDPDGLFGSKEKPDAVVLIDEIDKADPDVPNGLLVPLGAGQFRVPARQAPVVVPEGLACGRGDHHQRGTPAPPGVPAPVCGGRHPGPDQGFPGGDRQVARRRAGREARPGQKPAVRGAG